LIRDAAMAARREGSIPHELQIGLRAQRWGIPLVSGGLADQPVKLFVRADGLIPVFHAFQRRYMLRDMRDAEYSNKYRGDWAIIVEVNKLIEQMETGPVMERVYYKSMIHKMCGVEMSDLDFKMMYMTRPI